MLTQNMHYIQVRVICWIQVLGCMNVVVDVHTTFPNWPTHDHVRSTTELN